jgi:tetratricopeptide (TPR) repeat protein
MISIFASVVWAAATAISGDVDRLDEIDALRRQVQGQLEERDCHSHHMIGGFRYIADRDWELADPTSSLAKASKTLEDAVAAFEASAGDDSPLRNDLRFRLAKATLANVRQRYEETLKLVPETEVIPGPTLADTQVERNWALYQLRAEALYGLYRWEEALAAYRNMLRLRPRRASTRLEAATCLYNLKWYPEAIEELNAIIDSLKAEAEKSPGDHVICMLADAHKTRGAAVRDQGDRAKSIEDFNQAGILFNRLADQNNRMELIDELPGVLNERGIALHRLGDDENALRDHDQSLELYEMLLQAGRPDLRNDMGEALNNRGLAKSALRRLTEAIDDYTRAIELRAPLSGSRDAIMVAANVGKNHSNRGIALRQLNRLDEAIADYDKAIEIFKRLVEEQGRSEYAGLLSVFRNNRTAAMVYKKRQEDRPQE